MQALIRSKSAGITGGRGTAGAGPGRDLLYWVWGSPTPDHSSFRACGRGPLPTRCGCGGCGRGDPSPTPPRALLRTGFARCGGGIRVPRGRAPLAWASEVGRSPIPDRPSFGAGGRGPLPTGCWCGGCGRGDPSPTLQRALLRAGLARCGGGTRAPGGGRLLPGCEAFGVGRSPTPYHSSFRACGRGPLPTRFRCGGCGRGDPSPTPPHALLRAGFARCGGGMRVPRGRAPLAWTSRVGRSPTLDRPSFGACGRGPLPTGWGCGGCGRGDPSPTPQRALLRAGLARCGGGTSAPGGGASCLGAREPGSGALPPPTTHPFRCAAGAHYPLAVGAGGAGVGTCHQPHSARSCELALRAWGAARGCPGGAPLAWVWGVWGRALSQPRPLVLSGVRPGPTTHWLRARGLRAWRPVTNPTASALASWFCALWERHEGARGGGASCPGVGRPGTSVSPPPRPLVLSGVRPGPASHSPWMRCAGVGARLSLGPSPVPRFVLCCARFPGSRHPVAVVAWHLSSCRGCGWRRASLACLVAPLLSLSVLQSAFPSPWCLPPPQGLLPPALLGGCAGHVEAGSAK